MTRQRTSKHKHPLAPQAACKTVEKKGHRPTGRPEESQPDQPDHVCLSCGRVAKVEDHLCDPTAS